MAVTGVRSAAQVATVARDLADGQVLRLEGIELEGEDGVTGAELEAFEVIGDDTEIIVEGPDGPTVLDYERPVYLRGSLDGHAGSVAVVSVHADGEIRGIVSVSGSTWLLQAGKDGGSGASSGNGGLQTTKVDPKSKSHEFECDSDSEQHLVVNGSLAADGNNGGVAPDGGASGGEIAELPLAYTAQVAIELDHEFYLLHGSSASQAVSYATDLVAFTSAISLAELGMNIKIPFIRIWSGENDPYSTLNNSERLAQLRSWWNSSDATHCGDKACTAIKRATTLYLSGARTGGGVAYISAMCDAYKSPGNSYGYAFVGNITGSFNISDPRVVWDIVGTSHELGHNFGSQHTHCYQPAVDQCWSSTSTGCYNGPTSLPAGCPGGGNGCGTIMSYCHLLNGGMSNLTLTYGQGHAYGTLPSRVPTTMMNYLAVENVQTPGCFTASSDPVPEAPAPPTGLFAAALSSSQIQLEWADRSGNESGFKISRRIDTDTVWKDIATVGAGVISYTSTSLVAGTRYHFRVRAYNSVGESIHSNTASAITQGGTAPAAPTGLVAAPASSTTVLLNWNDNSNNETGFEIRRKVGTDGRFKKFATVSANSRSFQNTGLTGRTQYSYRVRAFNQIGRSKISNTASTKTP